MNGAEMVDAPMTCTRHGPLFKPGDPCSHRRYGCRGHLAVREASHRDQDGTLTRVLALMCDKCDQAHGLAPEAAAKQAAS